MVGLMENRKDCWMKIGKICDWKAIEESCFAECTVN